MSINSNSLAPANAVGGQNVAQISEAGVLKRKIIITGTYDPTIITVVDEVPTHVLSPDQVGAEYGFGFMLHRLAVRVFKAAPGVKIYVLPQSEAGGGAQSTGAILIDTAPGVNGTISFYVAGILVSVNVLAADTAAEVAGKIISEINANKLLPVTALVNATPEQLDITSKSSGGYWGDEITIKTNIKTGDTDPGSLAYTITPMAAGAGTPDIDDALSALGTGSAQNSDYYTDFIHGYEPAALTLDKISTYNGLADNKTGNYDDLVHRPFRSICGNNAIGTSGLLALIILGDSRKELDRTSGIIPVPGSASHPAEIGALALSYMANQNNNQAELSYKGIILEDIDPGVISDRWTNDYLTGRDAAAQAGISTTIVEGGVLKMQNALSFYHPASVAQNNNAYRNMRNISLIQNIFASVDLRFSQKDWQQFSIVDGNDLALVGNTDSSKTVKSTSSVIDTWIELFEAFINRAWIASFQNAVDNLKQTGAVTVRGAGNGFDVLNKFIFSGDGDIINNEIEYDISFATLN